MKAASHRILRDPANGGDRKAGQIPAHYALRSKADRHPRPLLGQNCLLEQKIGYYIKHYYYKL